MDLRIVVRYGLGSGGGHTKRIRCQTGLGHLLGVINERYERGALIVTSNWAFTEWLDLLQSPLLASAALDRLAHHAHQIVVTGDSFRARGRRRGGERSGSDPRRWCMNRNWPATILTQRLLTYRYRTTLARQDPSSDLGCCMRAAPRPFALLACALEGQCR